MKLKAKQGATNRFKVTKNGKVLRRHQLSRHLRQTKTASRKRRQAEPTQFEGKFKKTARRLLGKE